MVRLTQYVIRKNRRLTTHHIRYRMKRSPLQFGPLLLGVAFLIALAGLLVLANIPVDNHVQGATGLLIVALLLFLRVLPHRGLMRILFVGLAVFVVLRYLNWRTFYTLGYHDVLSFAGAIALYLAEVYGIVMFLISIFVNIRPIQREPVPLPDNPDALPSVDVFIPTYNEEVDLVKITLVAATEMRYPAHKRNIYLLDDGGTDEKLLQRDARMAHAARKRASALKALCAQLDVHYLSRERNVQAKAGNLNAALRRSHGDLIAVFDADHVPTVDFLEKTVGGFVEDPKLFLVQTPHYFVNPDPIEKNLEVFRRMPSESHMFFMNIQSGLDFWNASFFCGSAAVLRRQAIDECDGFACDTITEDAESAMMLHNRGWRSRYINYPLISGLQPETFASFMVQRMRWAQGMVQLIILKNPLKQKGLRIWQKICYLSSSLFWFFPLSRVVFLAAPSLFLIFGLRIYNANTSDLIVYVMPYLLSLVIAADYLFGRVRWTFSAEVYELMQSLFSLRAVISVMRHPRSPRFAVTPKAEKLETDFISPLSKPFYWAIAFNMIAFSFGLWHFYQYFDDPELRGIVVFALVWTGLNILVLMASLGALYERRQRRVNPRVPARLHGELVFKDRDRIRQNVAITVNDFSVGGANIAISKRAFRGFLDRNVKLRLATIVRDAPYEVDAVVSNFTRAGREAVIGLKFKPRNLQEYRDIVLLVHGDSSRWSHLLQNQDQGPGILPAFYILFKTGVWHGFFHLLAVLRGAVLVMLPRGRKRKIL